MKTVLLTGASGRIGRCLRMALRDNYRLILFNRSAIDDLGPSETLVRGDIADATAIEEAGCGADVIVDMAGVSDVQPFRTSLLPTNILGTYNTFECARVNRIPRVIYASTHHVVGFYPAGELLDDRAMVRPDSMYGVTKCFAEATGRLYAEKAGLQVVCLRIGFFAPQPTEERHLAVWISPGDMTRLVRSAIEAPNIQFEIVYGTSNNTRRWWDLERARTVLGYAPHDDAEAYAPALLKEPAGEWLMRIGVQGGKKAELPFMP